MEQVTLAPEQIQAFYTDCYAQTQVEHFSILMRGRKRAKRWVADLGGGLGYFARLLNLETGDPVRVIDTDEISIRHVSSLESAHVVGFTGDALSPQPMGDESVVCFNLILHHLIGRDEATTRSLQKGALISWRRNCEYVFINEFIYESLCGGLSARLIYWVTRSQTLSAVAKAISVVAPSLRANTFGVGVRFRSCGEWMELFEECGFKVVQTVSCTPEYLSLPRRLLLIREIRRVSFLLEPAAH